jgi:DNA binding domain, excisionase family
MRQKMNDNEYMSIKEASELLNVNPSTIYRWAKSGRLSLYKKGLRTTIIKRSDIERIKAENEQIRPLEK